MTLLKSQMVPLNTPVYEFSLPGIDGKTYSQDTFADKEIFIVVFMCNHCPYVKATINRLIETQDMYIDKGIQFVGINSNDETTYPEDSFENMKKFSKENGMNFPYLRDESQKVAKRYDAVCTPDIFMYGNDRTLVYRGRIDDNWKEETKVTRKDLISAINTTLMGKPISVVQFPAMGCSIKWKDT